MERVALTPEVREKAGKGVARGLRREKRVPAVLYSHGKSTPISMVSKDVTKVLNTEGGEHALINLKLEGAKEAGERMGGVIVMRHSANAMETIAAVKARLETLKQGLPEGVEIVTTYDRSGLIQRSVETLTQRLAEEFVVVALVCLAFLFHLRSSFVAIVSLPIGVLIAFVVMRAQGINANIMSLGGIAIAIGAMVDAAIVMIENMHKHLEHRRERQRSGERPQEGSDEGAAEPDYFKIAGAAAAEVGGLLASLLACWLAGWMARWLDGCESLNG